jgi:nicotinate dehydrogenase subunit B
MNGPAPIDPTRRRMVVGTGALVFSFAIAPLRAHGQPGAALGPGTDSSVGAANPTRLAGSLDKTPLLDAWIRIGADDQVTVFTGKAELGQGIKTALIQVAAEELVVAPDRIAIVTPDTARTPNEGYTSGSHSMQDSGTAIRYAAAQVRVILVDIAATRLGVPAGQLHVADGVVRDDASGRRLRYGELVGAETLHVRAAAQSVLTPPGAHVLIGKPMHRVDIAAKVTGGAAYVQDLRLPGLVHGRVVRPPSATATLHDVDTSPVAKMRGVLKIVLDGRFLGVVAQGEFEAVLAARALAAAAHWDETPSLPAPDDLYATLLASLSQDDTILDVGSVPATPAARSLTATYRRPYQMHGSIGPSCAIALVANDAWTVWTHTQGVYPLRDALAEMLGVDKENVRCIHVEGSGCYGHNGADDVAADAVLLARAWPGAPVRVQWMREDEHAFEPFGPPMIATVRATLDAAGSIRNWQYDVWSPPHSSRPGRAGDLLAATHLATPFEPSQPKPIPQPEGGGDRNAIPLYSLPAARVVHHFLPQPPLRVSALRSLGAYVNIFAVESFIDELARAADADPVAFRMRHLGDARAQQVVRVAAERFGWSDYRRVPGRGRGFAFARYKNLAAYAAIALEVEVRRETGEIRVLAAVAAVDCGEAVNPDGIRNQIEGGIVQASSWTLMEQVAFDGTRVTSRDWGGYPILRFRELPERIEIVVIDQPGKPFLGVGEASQGPTGAAIANAVADATGARMRDLPLTKARVRSSFEA